MKPDDDTTAADHDRGLPPPLLSIPEVGEPEQVGGQDERPIWPRGSARSPATRATTPIASAGRSSRRASPSTPTTRSVPGWAR